MRIQERPDAVAGCHVEIHFRIICVQRPGQKAADAIAHGRHVHRDGYSAEVPAQVRPQVEAIGVSLDGQVKQREWTAVVHAGIVTAGGHVVLQGTRRHQLPTADEKLAAGVVRARRQRLPCVGRCGAGELRSEKQQGRNDETANQVSHLDSPSKIPCELWRFGPRLPVASAIGAQNTGFRGVRVQARAA